MKAMYCLRVTLLLSALLTAACVACGGSPEDANAPRPAPSASLDISAKDLKFDKKALAAPAHTDVTIHFVNDDGDLLHNVALYRDKGAKEKVYAGELIKGKKTIDYRFTSPEAGTYYYRCDVHPDMSGVFYVGGP